MATIVPIQRTVFFSTVTVGKNTVRLIGTIEKKNNFQGNCFILWIDITPATSNGWILRFQSQFSISKSVFIYKKHFFYSFFRYMNNFCKSHVANIKFGNTLFSKIVSSFCRPHALPMHKSNFFETHSFFLIKSSKFCIRKLETPWPKW